MKKSNIKRMNMNRKILKNKRKNQMISKKAHPNHLKITVSISDLKDKQRHLKYQKIHNEK